MARQGLNRESVVRAAGQLIEEQGLAQFSMGKLARKLHVKTASLYNHVESLDELLECVGRYAVSSLVELENAAIEGRQRDEALNALAEVYRKFAREHCELYRVIMSFPKLNNPALDREAWEVIAPMLSVLSGYGLSDEQKMHWQRVLRSVMSGFAFHEQAGGFSHASADRDESFRMAIQCVADGLRRAGGEAQ